MGVVQPIPIRDSGHPGNVPNLAAELADLAARNRWTDRPAFHTPQGTFSHGQVHDMAARAANVLAARGVRQGSRVLIATPDGIGWVVAFLAAARLGATVVPVNPELTAANHRYITNDCSGSLAITTEQLADRFTSAEVLDVDALLAEARRAKPRQAEQTNHLLYVHYTSGTTGSPKGVTYRQGTPALYHQMIGHGCLAMTPDDVSLSVSKLYFGFGFCNSFVYPLYSGSSAVLMTGRPDPAEVAKLAARHRVTLLYAVPSWYARLVQSADPSSFSSLRAAMSAGERLIPELAGRAADFLGAPLLNQLGATEIGCPITSETVTRQSPGSIGWPVPGFEIQLRGGDGLAVADGEEGDLWVRGPVRMTGYLNHNDATAATIIDGWMTTRDRAVRNPDGSYTHIMRVDDMEMVGGIVVAPGEVEDLLGRHPLVAEIAVAAVIDEDGTSKLRAFVVPAGLVPDPTAFEAELIATARHSLTAYKVPRSVRLVAELPRTATGKLRRFVLREGRVA